jgi:RNA polymerase sigma-70 factor (ECF subfamily)
MMHNQDFVIIQRVLGGDRQAYAELVDRHKEKGMTLAFKMLKNREEAEEALQDAFIRAFNALPRFEWKSSFSTWFYRIVFNVCSTALSRRGTAHEVSLQEQEQEEEVQNLELASEDPLPDDILESSELNSIILEEIEKLPAQYGSTFTLFFVQDMTYEEIVQVTGLPLGTIKARLFRARLLLRDAVARRLGSSREGKRQEKVA